MYNEWWMVAVPLQRAAWPRSGGNSLPCGEAPLQLVRAAICPRRVPRGAPSHFLLVHHLSQARESPPCGQMERHVLTLKYDGLDAAYYGGIGTGGSKQVVAGAQILLGAHAHYYQSATVPDRINDSAPGFVIRDLGRKRGSLIAEFLVVLMADAVWDAARYSFTSFVLESYAAAKDGRLFDGPPFDHRPATLARTDGGNEPVFDLAGESLAQRRRLLQRVRQAREHISAPIRVTASLVEMSLDGYRLDSVRSRLPSEEDINAGLQLFRAAAGIARRAS